MNRRWIIVIGALILVVAIGALVYTQLFSGATAAPEFTADDLAVAQKGTLIATVSATGSIEPETSSPLAFLDSGNVVSIVVKRGDVVKKGQTLAKLDSAALELQLAQANANLAAAQAGYDKLKNGPTASEVSAAQANLDSAQKAYDAVKNPAASGVAAAKANVTSAQAQYAILLKPDPAQVAIARADVDKAKAALVQAQSAYDRIGGASNPFSAQAPQALQLQTATLDYQKALETYNSKFNATDAQLKAGMAQVKQAQDALDRLQPTADNLARAQAQVSQAQDALAKLTPTRDDLAQAAANLDASKAARDLAQERVTETTLVAPVDGTVTEVDLDQGAFVQAGRPVVTIADLAHLRINLSIDETDIPRVVVGQPVVLDLDAFPGQEVQGRVREIAPAAASEQGVVNYDVVIDVSPGKVPIKPGMTANANVQVARKDNVLLIPTRAIRAAGNKRLVTILDQGQPKEVAVTLGLSNDQDTEIVRGLDEGAQIITVALPEAVPGFGGFGNNKANSTPQAN